MITQDNAWRSLIRRNTKLRIFKTIVESILLWSIQNLYKSIVGANITTRRLQVVLAQSYLQRGSTTVQYARDVHRREATRTPAVGHLMRSHGTANEVLLWSPDGSLGRCQTCGAPASMELVTTIDRNK